MKLVFSFPRTLATACFALAACAGGASSAAAQSCGEMGGDECMQSGPCPPGYESLGPSEDCPGACCVRGPSCGERGGEECMQTGSCPSGYQSLGPTWDCPAACCDYVDPGPTCTEMGGETCGSGGHCGVYHESIGPSSDCGTCCRRLPSCGSLGGPEAECGQGGVCPPGYEYLSASGDCNPCCEPVTPPATDGAAVAAVNLPTSMTCGSTYDAWVRMTNTGNTTWTSGAGYKLGTVGDQDPLHALTRVYLPDGVSVPPGGSHTFYMTLTAPGSAGTVVTDWQMVNDPGGWFGGIAARSVSITCAPPDTDGAQVAAANLPASLSCGATYAASVTMTNTGTTTWTSAGEYKLGTVGDQDPFFAATRVYLPDGVSVPPGASHTFTMTLTAPSSAGTFVTDWRMVRDPVGWFGATAAQSVAVSCAPTGTDNAQVVATDLPAGLACGATYEASVTMQNTGTTTWTTAGEYKLGAVDDSDPFFAGTRAYLPDGVSVPPGASHTFHITLTAPAENGTHLTDWRMVRDGVAWFGGTASRSVSVTCLQAGDHAEIAGLDLPSSMLCSGTRPSSITLRNAGTTTWFPGQYELAALGGGDPFVPGGSVALTAEVPPAGTHAFNLTLAAPAHPGPYVTDWQMRRGNAWFGAVVSQDVLVECQEQGDAARVTDINIPFALPCGESAAASVTMMNTGTTTWRRQGTRADGTLQRYRLGAVGESDPFTTARRVPLGQGVAVPPGSSHTFHMTLTAPATDGIYTTDWQMVIDDGEGGASWFGGLALRNVVVACQDLDDADAAGDNLPSSLAAGQSFEAYVKMQNTGTTTWRAADQYRLGAVDDSDPFTTQTRVELSKDVPPGDQETFRFTLVGTGSSGTTDWRMVHDGVAWFGATTSQSVSGSSLPPERVAICPSVDPSIMADRNGEEPAHEAIQRCIDETTNGTARIVPGTYRIGSQLRLDDPITFGSVAPTPAGNWWETPCDPSGGTCAVLRAGDGFSADGILSMSGSDVVVDHIVLDGNRAGRLRNRPNPTCANREGNAKVRCSSCQLSYSVSKNALCFSGVEWVGREARILHNIIRDNGGDGRHGDPHLMWADGVTLLDSDGAVVRDNQFIENTDIGLILGGARNATIVRNTITNSGQHAFGGLMLDNFAGSQHGDFTGTVVGGSDANRNTIDCNGNCEFGIQLGPHPWYLYHLHADGSPDCARPARNIIGGTVTHNRVTGALQGLNIDGAGEQGAPIVVHDNTVTGSPGGTQRLHLCATNLPVSNYNYYLVPQQGGPPQGDSWVDTRGVPLPPGESWTMNRFHACAHTQPCNHAPTADAGLPLYPGRSGVAVTFDGSRSTDVDGGDLRFSWDFGDGTPAGSGPRPTHTYTTTTLREFPVRLTVTDEWEATDTADTIARIEPNAAPTVSVTTGGTCGAGCNVTFTSVASDPEGEPLFRAWSGCATGSADSASCAKGSSGSVAATVTVTDPAGNAAAASASVPVYVASYTTGTWTTCTGTGSYTCTAATPTGCSRPGTQTRTVTEASWTLNPAAAVPAPATTQACTQTTQGYVASYYVGPWSGCSRSCGGGTQTRTVYANSWKAVAPSVGWPGDSQSCNTHPCELTCYDYPTCYPTKSECYGAGWSVCEIRYRDNGVGGLLTCWKGF